MDSINQMASMMMKNRGQNNFFIGTKTHNHLSINGIEFNDSEIKKLNGIRLERYRIGSQFLVVMMDGMFICLGEVSI